MAICRKCGAQIEYRVTLRGNKLPVDPTRVAVITRRGTVVHGWISHFSTCHTRKRRLPPELHIVQRRFEPE